MFGIFRYFLSLMVALGHINFTFQGRWNWTGNYAVFGFFVLSGFLMTRVLHRTYGYSPRGLATYLANRALRIYPAYWAALGISLFLLVWIPDYGGYARELIHLPTTAAEYFFSVVLIGVTRDFSPRVVPPSWSLHIELCFYILLGLGLSRRRWSTAVWIAASIGWTVWAVEHDLNFGDRYSTLIAASLPFSLGAGLHFVDWHVHRWLLAVGIAAFAVHTFAAGVVWGDPQAPAAFYTSLALVLLLVAGLRDIRPTGRLASVDKLLGDLSYPIFLIHAQVGCLFVWLDWGRTGSFGQFLLCLPLIHIVSAAIHFSTAAPVETLRTRIRSRGAANARSAQSTR